MKNKQITNEMTELEFIQLCYFKYKDEMLRRKMKDVTKLMDTIATSVINGDTDGLSEKYNSNKRSDFINDTKYNASFEYFNEMLLLSKDVSDLLTVEQLKQWSSIKFKREVEKVKSEIKIDDNDDGGMILRKAPNGRVYRVR